MKKFFAPEVVQTSNMDCGPAALKCLLEGFGRPVSYGRLREACQTGIDGTSIDTMEAVANQLGLEAEQIMLPADHLLLSESKSFPAIVVVKLPTGLTHFVVVWRRHGNMLQIMDPSVGRRWVKCRQFRNEIYEHTLAVPAADWRAFAASADFQTALTARICRSGITRGQALPIQKEALNDTGWRRLAALDAAVRLMGVLAKSDGVSGSNECARLLRRLCARPELIPSRYWSARPCPDIKETDEQVLMRGAVLVRVRDVGGEVHDDNVAPELKAAIQELPLKPGYELLRLFQKGGLANSGLLLFALAAAAGGVFVEALLFRGFFDVATELGLAGQRMGAMMAMLLFGFALLLIEMPIASGALRLGRQVENRLRAAFLDKIPKLGDRYFHSRLTSDMAERSHTTHRLRGLPELARQLSRDVFELLVTAGGILWLEPKAWPFVLFIVAAALVPPFLSQPVLAERDLRVRTHSAGLTRFYLDAMLGLLTIRAHGAERSVRREHEKLLGEWAQAGLRLQRTVTALEALQLTAMFALVACLLLLHPLQGSEIGRALLVAYWALNLPALGQDIGALARQYPSLRNMTLRLLDPLGAPEEKEEPAHVGDFAELAQPPAIEFRNVSVAVSGHTILDQIDLQIEPGSHVAIVGSSGAGKSSLVGLLLGWLKPESGQILVDSLPLNCARLRASMAWVDPAVHLWNRSLFSNLTYGSEAHAGAVGSAIDTALLRSVLETLPEGLQTRLGEGGALVSGGEGQRVRFARALLRSNVQLAILDEPFRGLDREKRRELLARARRFWRNSTLLCITHDLSETRSFDRILVVEQGRIVEQGTPGELCRTPGSRYSQLLEAELQTRSDLWSSGLWRRVHIHSGKVVEELPREAEERFSEKEVA